MEVSRILWRVGVVLAGAWAAYWFALGAISNVQGEYALVAIWGAIGIAGVGFGLAWAFRSPRSTG